MGFIWNYMDLYGIYMGSIWDLYGILYGMAPPFDSVQLTYKWLN